MSHFKKKIIELNEDNFLLAWPNFQTILTLYGTKDDVFNNKVDVLNMVINRKWYKHWKHNHNTFTFILNLFLKVVVK